MLTSSQFSGGPRKRTSMSKLVGSALVVVELFLVRPRVNWAPPRGEEPRVVVVVPVCFCSKKK